MLITRLAKQGYSRARASLSERVFRKTGLDLTRPAFIQCVLTERCNYKCLYCFHWRQDSYTDEMSPADWKRAILSIHDFARPILLDFTGGEPFVYPDFIELVEFCHARGIDWCCTTNGSALANQKYVRRIVAAKPLKIDVSVDSASGEIHDKARGIDGSLARIEKGLRLLVSEQAKARQHFPIRIKVTVHRYNAGKLKDLVRWSKLHGATSIDFNRARLWRESDKRELYVAGSEDLKKLHDQLEKLILLKANGEPIETGEAELRSIEDGFAGTLEYASAHCRSAIRDFVIKPNGDVRVCPCTAPVGNLKRNTAREIWWSDAAKSARRRSLDCSLQLAVAKGKASCTAHRTILKDLPRAFLLLTKR